jgi:hypothetical protein
MLDFDSSPTYKLSQLRDTGLECEDGFWLALEKGLKELSTSTFRFNDLSLLNP